jgi:hypothetical protein
VAYQIAAGSAGWPVLFRFAVHDFLPRVPELGPLGDFTRMTPLEDIATQLKSLWGGQTLATLRDEATRELDGTCFQSLRLGEGPRRVLICCVTGEHELRRLGRLDPSGAQSFGDWSDVSLFETVARTIMAGGFAYGFDRSGSRSSYLPVVLIASVPDSIAKLERLLGLQP